MKTYNFLFHTSSFGKSVGKYKFHQLFLLLFAYIFSIFSVIIPTFCPSFASPNDSTLNKAAMYITVSNGNASQVSEAVQKNYRVIKVWNEFNIIKVIPLKSAVIVSEDLKAVSPDILSLHPEKGMTINSQKRPSEILTSQQIKSRPRYHNWAVDICESAFVNTKMGIQGRNTRIGIIDTGIQADHPDLNGKLLTFKDFFTPSNTQPIDLHGHGTFQAGIIAGEKRSGFAPEAGLIVARVFNPPYETPLSSILDALEWMLDPDGDPNTDDAPQVINNAWGNDLKKDDFFLPVVKKIFEKGILPVFEISPRGGSGCGCPANYGEAFTAASLTQSLNISYLSSHGLSPYTFQSKPELSAPGEWIFSTWNNSSYTVKDGPSCAAAVTTGIAALVLEAAPNLKVTELKKVLINGVTPFPNPEWVGKRGGKGVINARQSVLLGAKCGKVDFSITTVATEEDECDGGLWNIESRAHVFVPALGLDADPEQSLFLAPGSWDIVIKKAGYQSISQNLVVTPDSLINLNFNLQPLECSKMVINWDIDPIFEPEWFEIKLKNKSTGGFWFFQGIPRTARLPFGTWDLTFDAAGFYPIIVKDVNIDSRGIQLLSDKKSDAPGNKKSISISIEDNNMSRLDVPMKRLESLIFIDDDKSRLSDKPVYQALKDLEIEFHYFEYDKRTDKINARYLKQFSSVLWCLGNEMSNVLSKSDISALEDYSLSGGGIILSGQDLAYKLQRSSEFKKLFKSELKYDNAVVKEIHSFDDSSLLSGLVFSIDTSERDRVQWSPDAIFASPGPGAGNAFEILKYQSGTFNPGSAAVAVDHVTSRRILFSFGLEAVTDNKILMDILSRSLSWTLFSKKDLLLRYLAISKLALKSAKPDNQIDDQQSILNASRQALLKRLISYISVDQAKNMAKSLSKIEDKQLCQPLVSALLQLEKADPKNYFGLSNLLGLPVE